MVNPQTVNVGIIVPLTGADVDTWGEDDVNPNMAAIDGLFGGVQGISLSNAPVTLTSPAGFTPTPSAGPVQSQNRVLRFTGTLLADVTVTLPLPGSYLVDNQCDGNFVVTLRGVTATEVVGLPPGEVVEIYNDGSRVRFVGLGRMGTMEHWSGISAMPAWVAACTKLPYLPCDNVTTYNISDFPFLGGRYLGKFGGNGITTFKTPDMGGRVPLAYDYTGTRITAAGCGINGQTLGASNTNAQNNTLATNQIPTLTSNGNNSITVSSGNTGGSGSDVIRSNNNFSEAVGNPGSPTGSTVPIGAVITRAALVSTNPAQAISVTYTNASQQVVNNVQPAQVTGIWVVKT